MRRQRPGRRDVQGNLGRRSAAARQPCLFSVNAITTGTESQGEVTVRLAKSGRVVNGIGADPDIVVASAKAYLNALDKLHSKADRVNPARRRVMAAGRARKALRRVASLLAVLALSAAWLPAPAQPADPIRLAVIEGFSGPFANAGDSVWRNLLFAVERVNARGGVRVAGQPRQLAVERLDSQGQVEEAIAMLRRATDQRIPFVLGRATARRSRPR